MQRRPTSRLVLIQLAGIAAGTILAVGCPSGGDSGDGRSAAERPADQAASPSPQVLPDGAESPPMDRRAAESGTAPAGPLRSQADEEPFDPIKVNGPIFVDWPRPKLALVITGRQDGYIEPCGCAGLDRMKGGMSRRHSFIDQLRNKQGWPVVAIDAGGVAKGYGIQAELKFHIMVEGMRQMGYDAIALGKAELRLPAGELLTETASTGDQQSPFLSANVALFGFDAGLTAQTRIIEAGDTKLGITAVLGKQYQEEIRNDELELADPSAALAQVVTDLRQKADYLILLAHATKEESIELARQFPDFDLVVTAGGAAEPPARPTPIEGTRALLIEVGHKGMDAVVLGMFDNPTRPRYQRVPLDSRFPASSEMEHLMEVYQEQLKGLGFEGLGLRPVPHPQRDLGGKFVGSEKCASCHEESYIIWKKSGHAKAYATLTELTPPRNFDPECVSCHVVGWHPTEYYPYQSGYQSLEDTPHLINTGCETCHGPGSAHVAAENGTDLDLQDRFRLAVRITKEEAQDPGSGKMHCYSCHDLDNSPAFDFETYWPLVEHYEDLDE